MGKPNTEAVIDLILAGHRRRRRPEDCALIDWVKAQAHLERDELLRQMIRLPGWEPRFTADCIVDCAHLFGPEQCLHDQTLYVDALEEYGFAASRSAVEALLTLHGDRLEPQIAQRLIEWVAAHHPNARAFLAQPKVLRNIPTTADLACVEGSPRLKGKRKCDGPRPTRPPRETFEAIVAGAPVVADV